MEPNLPIVPPDPVFHTIVNKLLTFHSMQLPPDATGMATKKEAEQVAMDVLQEALAMVEQFAQNRSSLAKYDLLKWIGNKKNEVKLYS